MYAPKSENVKNRQSYNIKHIEGTDLVIWHCISKSELN